MQRLQVDIWSDIACPWCYVGKRRFEAALASFEERASVDVRWRSFELNPGAPQVEQFDGSYGERLARKYGVTAASGEEMVRSMTETAAAEGLDFRFDRIRPGNTFDAHRLVHLAATQGLGDAAKERLMRAYMTEGAAMGERDGLVQLAAELGLDTDEVRAMFEGDTFEQAVRADEEEARVRGISGVPYFLIGGQHGLSGAQPPELLLRALRAGWNDLESARTAAGDDASEDGATGDGESCGIDGCD